LQAQEELLAGVAKTAASGSRAITDVVTEPINMELVEEYDRAMSPPLLDITNLSTEERQVDILTEKEDRQNLVCFWTFTKGAQIIIFFS